LGKLSAVRQLDDSRNDKASYKNVNSLPIESVEDGFNKIPPEVFSRGLLNHDKYLFILAGNRDNIDGE